jgi:hypothetical protein
MGVEFFGGKHSHDSDADEITVALRYVVRYSPRAAKALLGELWMGGAVLVGAVISVGVIAWLRKRATHRERPNEYLGKMYQLLDKDRGNWISRISRNIEFLLKKGVFIHYVVLFSVLGLLPMMMRIAALAANLTWILALYFKRRFFRGRRSVAQAVPFHTIAKVNS